MEPVPIQPLPGPIPLSNGYPRHKTQQYSKSEWQSQKPIIKRFFIDQGESLKRVMKIMTEEHDFHPTRKMYVDHLDSWGFKKNCTKKSISNWLHQKGEGGAATTRASRLGGEGKLICAERLEEHLKRTNQDIEGLAVNRDEQAKGTDGEKVRQASTPINLDFQDVQSNSIWSQYLPSVEPPVEPSTSGDYEVHCPYWPRTKKFRLIESFPNGAMYKADSLGFRSYIAADSERSCIENCYCRQHTLSNDFSFQVHKYIDRMDVTLFSDDLYHNLLRYELEDLQEGVTNQEKVVNGLILLKNYHYLKSQTDALRSETCHDPSTNSLLLEMELLVDGLLADGEVFKSFGYEELYERELLDFKLWKKFQQDTFERDVSALEEGFDEIDDEYDDLPTPPQQSNSSKGHDPNEDLEGVPTCLWREFSSNEKSIPSGSAADAANDFDCDFRLAPTTDLFTVEYATPAIKDCEAFEALVIPDLSLADAADAGNQAVVRRPLDDRAKINSGYFLNTQTTLLIKAAKAGQEVVARLLLDRGANIEGGYDFPLPTTPLIEAAKAGHEAVARLLLDRGANIEGGYDFLYLRTTPLIEAVKAVHEVVARLLFDRVANIENGYSSYLRTTPLIEAVKAGHEAVVQLLLERGGDINGYEQPINDAMVQSVICGQMSKMWRFIKVGADINAITRFGTALSAAARLQRYSQLVLKHQKSRFFGTPEFRTQPPA